MRFTYETKNRPGENEISGVYGLRSFFSGRYRQCLFFKPGTGKGRKIKGCLCSGVHSKQGKIPVEPVSGGVRTGENIIESGYDIDGEKFSILSQMMQDKQNVIEAHELAKDGIVSHIYPMKGNEEAMGLNMLEHPDRKKEANLAKTSGQYTIAGPFPLVQGGNGALLFDPVYVKDEAGEDTFWGFSILVLNWDHFMEEVETYKLEDASYQYLIWKMAQNWEKS